MGWLFFSQLRPKVDLIKGRTTIQETPNGKIESGVQQFTFGLPLRIEY